MNFYTVCTILVAFSPETLEFTLLTVAPFAAIRQNWHIAQNISEYPGSTLALNDLYSLLWHSITDWPIVNLHSKVSTAIIKQHCPQFGELPSNNVRC